MELFKKKEILYSGPLISTDDRERNREIQKIFDMAKIGDIMAVKKIELALRQLGAKENAEYHHPSYGTTITYNAHHSMAALNNLARQGKMLDDPALTQQLIIKSGPLQSEVVAFLQGLDKKNMFSYVLLGVHMQANIMLSQNR